MQPGKAKSLHAASSVSALIDAAVQGELDEAQAFRLCTELRSSSPSRYLRRANELPVESIRSPRRSAGGAATQSILMSVYRTLKLRGLNQTQTIAEALKTYLTTGQLPSLPA